MKIIAITSGKGGVGKSCVAAYTGAALAKGGLKTLIIELGANYRSLDLITESKGVYDIGDVFSETCLPGEAVVETALFPGLYLLPGSPDPVVPQDGLELDTLLAAFEEEYDFVLLDGVDWAVHSLKVPDSILVVTTPDSLSIRACSHQVRTLYGEGAGNIRLVINAVPAKILPIQNVRDFDDIIDQIGAQLIAVIPESPKLRYSSNNAQLLDSESLTIQVFDNLASRLQGKRRPLLVR